MTHKIRDNPSIQELTSMVEPLSKIFYFIDKVPILYKYLPKFYEVSKVFKGIEQQIYLCDLPDQFNSTFAEYGWIGYDSMPLDVMKESIKLANEVNLEEALNYLMNSYDEKSIEHIILRAKSRDHFEKRVRLLNLAKEDYLAARYHACIPLMLSLIDGLSGDVSKHVGFFAEKSDFELFDSMVGHHTGLPFLKVIMNTTRKVTNEETISTPYRNGILHGRELNFNNKINAAKCWMLLDCIIDWADGFTSPKNPEKEISLIESLNSLNETNKLTERINLWSKRKFDNDINWTILSKTQVPSNTPEYILLSFMESWQKAHWGKLVPLLLHCFNTSNKQIVKEIKDDYSPITLISFSILTVEDISPAKTDISMKVHIVKNNLSSEKELQISLVYADKNGFPLLRGEPNGKWGIIQNGFSSILFPSS